MPGPDVLYVADIARKLGRTERAIRLAIIAKSESIPTPFKMGKLWAWRVSDVDQWLKEKAEGSGGAREAK